MLKQRSIWASRQDYQGKGGEDWNIFTVASSFSELAYPIPISIPCNKGASTLKKTQTHTQFKSYQQSY